MRTAWRVLTGLCISYLLLLLYASLMPFDLVAEEPVVREHLRRALGSWPFGHYVHTSRADMLSNFALYVPLGGLLAMRWTVRRTAFRWFCGFAAGAAACCVSFAVEAGQLWSMTRIASAQDWLVNTCGGFLGAAIGAACGRRAWVSLTRAVRLRLARRPIALVAAALLLILAADGLFPFLPTLDVSQVKAGLRGSHLALSGGFAAHPWHHWPVRRAAVYAVLAALLGAASLDSQRGRFLRGAVLTIGFVLAVEVAKPFIVSRVANIANVVTGAAGAAIGGLSGVALAGRLRRRAASFLAAGLVVIYLVYLEGRPFQFRWEPPAMRQKVPRGAEWLPIYHYAMGARPEDVRLFCRTLILTAALALAMLLPRSRPAGRREMAAAVVLAGGLGLCLEALQFLLPGRVPSTTDVCTFALGGLLGTWVHRRIARRYLLPRGADPPPRRTRKPE